MNARTLLARALSAANAALVRWERFNADAERWLDAAESAMGRRRVEDDGQRPLPFRGGLAPKLRKPARTWRYVDGSMARICPGCGCNAERRCTIALDGGGTATCVPAGVYGRRVCSACRQPSLPGVS